MKLRPASPARLIAEPSKESVSVTDKDSAVKFSFKLADSLPEQPAYYTFDNFTATFTATFVTVTVDKKGHMPDTAKLTHDGVCYLMMPHTSNPPYDSKQDNNEASCNEIANDIQNCFHNEEEDNVMCRARLAGESMRKCCKALYERDIYIPCLS
mgnify:CR=1 FL=1